ALATVADRGIDLPDTLRRGLGYGADANRFGFGARLRLDFHLLSLGLGLRNQGSIKFGLTLHGHRLLTLGLSLPNKGGIRGGGLLQLALRIGNPPLGLELGLFGTAALLRGHNISVGLRLRGGLAPPCLSNFGLHYLNVERIEAEPQIGQLARAGFSD